jgi:hypothetical protein
MRFCGRSKGKDERNRSIGEAATKRREEDEAEYSVWRKGVYNNHALSRQCTRYIRRPLTHAHVPGHTRSPNTFTLFVLARSSLPPAEPDADASCWIWASVLTSTLAEDMFYSTVFIARSTGWSRGLMRRRPCLGSCEWRVFLQIFDDRDGSLISIVRVLRPCLVFHLKFFYPSHQIFGHMYGILNVHKK